MSLTTRKVLEDVAREHGWTVVPSPGHERDVRYFRGEDQCNVSYSIHGGVTGGGYPGPHHFSGRNKAGQVLAYLMRAQPEESL